MEMWIDLVLDEDVGVGAEFEFEELLIDVRMDSGFEEPYPTIYVFVPVFGASEFGEPGREFSTPVFYHVINDVNRIGFVSRHGDRHHTDVSVAVVVEAGD